MPAPRRFSSVVEHPICNRTVVSSTLTTGSKSKAAYFLRIMEISGFNLQATAMHYHISHAAAALLVAPICIVAQAKTLEENIEEGLAVLDELVTILEKVTPENAEACTEELEQLSAKMQELKKEEANYTDEEKKEVLQNPEIIAKLQAPIQRLFMAIMKLQATAQSATPEQQAELQKVIEKLQAVKS